MRPLRTLYPAVPSFAQERGPAAHLPAAFAAWNRDDAVRKDSTSGGAFTAIAEYVLEGGGVVYGAAMDGHQHLRHIPCFRKEDLWRLRGAKYVQSDLDGVFREIREVLKTRPVLFSGTPCQVDGLYRFLGCRPENLTTCDLVCHGVPSPVCGRTRPGLSKEINGGGWQMSASAIRWRGGRTATLPLYMTMALRIPHPCLPQALAGLWPGAVSAPELPRLPIYKSEPSRRFYVGGSVGPAAG